MQYDLSLCPMYNGREACCNTAFEAEQNIAFGRWVAHFKLVKENLHHFQMEMEALKVSRAYVEVSFTEKALFDKAFASFNPVLDTFGTCFDVFLEFMAGVVCFACDPQWRGKVVLDDQGLSAIALRIHDSQNDDLWGSCRQFGAAADDLVARLVDSTLAKSVQSRFEDLRPFASRIGVAQYMADNGLVPMRPPAELVLRVEPEEGVFQEEGSRRLQATSSGAEMLLFPVRDGRASAFECSIFPRMALPSGAAGALGGPAARSLWIVLSSLVAGSVAVATALEPP